MKYIKRGGEDHRTAIFYVTNVWSSFILQLNEAVLRQAGSTTQIGAALKMLLPPSMRGLVQ